MMGRTRVFRPPPMAADRNGGRPHAEFRYCARVSGLPESAGRLIPCGIRLRHSRRDHCYVRLVSRDGRCRRLCRAYPIANRPFPARRHAGPRAVIRVFGGRGDIWLPPGGAPPAIVPRVGTRSSRLAPLGGLRYGRSGRHRTSRWWSAPNGKEGARPGERGMHAPDCRTSVRRFPRCRGRESNPHVLSDKSF